MKLLEKIKEVVTIDGVCVFGQAMSLAVDGEEIVFIAPSKESLARMKERLYPGDEPFIEEKTSEVVMCGTNRIVGKGSSE